MISGNERDPSAYCLLAGRSSISDGAFGSSNMNIPVRTLMKLRTRMQLALLVLAATPGVHGATRTWDGRAGDGLWFSPANWSPDGVPDTGDDVVIGRGATVSLYMPKTVTIRSLSCAGTLTIDSTYLVMTAASSVSGTMIIDGDLNAGIGGAGTLTIDGVLITPYGRFGAGGSLIISAGAQWHIPFASGFRTIQRPVICHGTMTIGDGLTLEIGSTFDIYGTASTVANSGITITGASANGVFRNFGTFVKGGAGPMRVMSNGQCVGFENRGPFYLNGGTLNLNCNGTHSGPFSMADSSCLMQLNATQVFQVGASVNGPGTLQMVSGTSTFNDPVAVGSYIASSGTCTFNSSMSAPNTTFNATSTTNVFGTFSGPYHIAVDGTLDLGTQTYVQPSLTMNGTLKTSGEVTISNSFVSSTARFFGGGTVIFPANLSVTGLFTIDIGVTLINYGTITWGNGADVRLQGGKLINEGTLIFNPTGQTSDVEFYSVSGVTEFRNNGLLIKDGAGSLRFSFAPPTTTRNDGVVDVRCGTAQFPGGSHTGEFLVHQTVAGDTPALWILRETTLEADAIIDVQSPGTLIVDSGGTLTNWGQITIAAGAAMEQRRTNIVMNGTFQCDGALTLIPSTTPATWTFPVSPTFGPSSSITLNSSSKLVVNAPVTIPRLTLTFGEITGTADLTVLNQFTWTQALLTGAGRLILDTGCTGAWIANQGSAISKTLENRGTLNMTSFNTDLAGGTILNSGTLSIDGQNASNVIRANSGTNVINNTGTIIKNGNDTLLLSLNGGQLSLQNTGVINVQVGTLRVECVTTGTGDLNVAANANLTLTKAASGGSMQNAGTLLMFDPARLALTGSYQQTSTGKLDLRLTPPLLTDPRVPCASAQVQGVFVGAYSFPLAATTPLPLIACTAPQFTGGFSQLTLSPVGRVDYAADSAKWVIYRAGDANGDNAVNVSDLLLVISNWGVCTTTPCPGDVAPSNGNGLVNVADLLMVISSWSS